MSITAKPILIDKLNSELAPKIVEAIIKDNARAKKAREAKKKKKRDADRSTQDR
jgi:hypothetical protein